MNIFLLNLTLAIFWAAVTGELSLKTLSFGFMVGYGVLLITSRALGHAHYFKKIYLLVAFVLFVTYELVKSSLRIAFDILTLHHHMRPAILKILIDAKSDIEITLLANLISLTPGTLTVDISEDRKYLFMHAMYIHGHDFEAVRTQIKHNYEHRLLELLR